MGRISELSDCEVLVMKCIWEEDRGVTAFEVIDKLKEEYNLQYKSTTVYTFLQKLKDKGFLDTYQKDFLYYYPVRDREQFCRQRLVREEKMWYNGSPCEMIAGILNATYISDEEKEKIKKLILDL